MRALTIIPEASGGTLSVVEVPRPEPGPDDVLVRVHGAGVNRADLLQLAGRYPAPPGVPADIPGLEFAGIVEAIGAAVVAPVPGDRVYGIVGGGAQAEYITVRADQCAIVPTGLDLVEAGGVPEVFITAHDALRTCAGLEPGERVLVHAAGSGVGTAVIQLARAFDCEIAGTARTAGKLERARELGLDHPIVVPSGSGPFDPDALTMLIAEAAGPIDVVVDLVGGDYLITDVGAAAPRARIVLVGMLAGATATLPIHTVMGKRLTIVGTVLRARSLLEKAEATGAFAMETSRWWDDNTLGPIVDRIIPLDDARSAYDLVASDTTFGKVILDTRRPD
ncbi:MAG: NAD(P)H-quinone oxidoreductase [Acidimicrobiia bacterium]